MLGCQNNFKISTAEQKLHTRPKHIFVQDRQQRNWAASAVDDQKKKQTTFTMAHLKRLACNLGFSSFSIHMKCNSKNLFPFKNFILSLNED